MNAAVLVFPGLLDGASGWACVEGRVYVLSPGTEEVTHEEIKVARGARASEEPSDTRGPSAFLVCEMCESFPCACEELTAPSWGVLGKE